MSRPKAGIQGNVKVQGMGKDQSFSLSPKNGNPWMIHGKWVNIEAC